ncbi:MAG TPA: DUF4424 domain-containing protein [Devosia sp.]|nr:DUF4424 domain-containing protein [Devosia sp.]
MKRSVVALGLALLTAPALANDTTSQLGTGGLVFVTNQDISMDSEDLSVGPNQVKVVYQFTNTSRTEQHVLVAFPLPDITGDGDFMVAVPNEDPRNLFGFITTFNGQPVQSTLHQYAFAVGIDQTALLKSLNVPLAPFGKATIDAINALPDTDHQQLLHLGMVIPMTYDAGNGEQTDWTPVWTLKSTYSWEADFKAGQTAQVVHAYTPSVGSTVATTFLEPPTDATQEDRPKEYRDKYCTDDDLIRTLKKSLRDPGDLNSAPYQERWISYVWSTGANWSGPIGKFHLTIDKGDPKDLVSFCWGGKVTKTGPTKFEMNATDWYPPEGRELEILILAHQDASSNAG